MLASRSVALFATLSIACTSAEERRAPEPKPASAALQIGDLKAEVTSQGVRLSTGKVTSRLATRAIGRAGAMVEAPVRTIEEGARVVLVRDGVREWWTTRARQLEFGYDVAARPKGDGPLSIVLSATGDGAFRVSNEGAVAFLEGAAPSPLLELLDLHVRDARGRELPARFAMRGDELTIEVDDTAAVYPIVVDPTVVTGIETKLSLSGSAASKFGPTLALSADGNHMLVKNGADTSVVFHDYTAGAWTSTGSVTFPTASGGADEYGAFGDALAFAADNTALISSYRFKYNSPVLNWAGGIFAFNLSRAYQTTIKQSPAASDDQFGFSMAAEGNSIIVGARSTSGYTAAAYVFTHTSGTTYTQQAKLAQPTGTVYFGWTVAIQGDDALVGVLNNRTTYAYRRSGTTWSAGTELQPTGLVSGDGYGLVLAVGGKTALIGASGKTLTAAGDGQVYVYKDTGSSWTAEGPMFTAPPAGAAGGAVGGALAITPDGNTAFVGANKAAGGQGRVYVLTRSGTSWNLVRTLAPSDPSTVAFGSTLALAGSRLAVSAPSSTGTSFVYVFDPALGLAPAATCTGASDCASSFCVDGVCCDSACTGTCEACNVAGKEGTCTPVKGSPLAPRAACPATGTGACASSCDGTTRDACVLPGATVSCGTASCDSSGAMVGLGTCDGTGKCTAPAPKTCAPFVCADGACKTTCKLDTECAEGARCTGGTCVVGIPDGGPSSTPGLVKECKADSECATGHCADGVCCDQPCKNKCSSCAIPGYVGKCVAESGIDLRGDCSAASCTTTCQAGECRPVRAGDQCAPSLCVDTHTAQGPSTCSAAGAACTATTGTLDCSPYICALGTCLTACIDSTQCASGTVCDTTQQRCVTAPTENSGGCAIVAPGAPHMEGYAWTVTALALFALVRRRRMVRPRQPIGESAF